MRTRIPRRRDGSRNLRKLDTSERTVLALLYREARTAEDLARACSLSLGQVASALKRLMSPQRCGPLGALAVERDGEGIYHVTAQWRATHRTGATSPASA